MSRLDKACPTILQAPLGLVSFGHPATDVSAVYVCEKLSKSSIIAHFADTERIIAPSSLHMEEEERTFSSVNSISLATSSRTMEHVRDNSIIRMQAEKNLARKKQQKG